MKTADLSTRLLQALSMLLLFVLRSIVSEAQVNIQFMPFLNGQSVNGLFTAVVQNTTPEIYNGKIKIVVKDANNKLLLLVITPPIVIRPGANFIGGLASQSKIQFSNNPSANIIAQTGRFPENEYEYCFEFTGTENKAGAGEKVFENCYNYAVRPIIPLALVYPAEGDELCNTRPGFTWQPAMPLVSSYRYHIIIAEKKKRAGHG